MFLFHSDAKHFKKFTGTISKSMVNILNTRYSLAGLMKNAFKIFNDFKKDRFLWNHSITQDCNRTWTVWLQNRSEFSTLPFVLVRFLHRKSFLFHPVRGLLVPFQNLWHFQTEMISRKNCNGHCCCISFWFVFKQKSKCLWIYFTTSDSAFYCNFAKNLTTKIVMEFQLLFGSISL